MAQVIEHASGSTTPTLATDTQLGSDITVAGIFILRIDVDNLVDGETLIGIFKQKVRTGDSVKEDERRVIARHAQGPGVQVPFGPFESVHNCSFWIRQENGTARAFNWSIRKFDNA